MPMFAPAAAEFDIWSFISVLRRRWPVLVAAWAVTISAAVLYTAIKTPEYRAVASVMLNQRTAAVVRDDPQVLSDLPRGAEVVDTQVEYIKGERLAAVVAQNLGLDRDSRPLGADIGFFEAVGRGFEHYLGRDSVRSAPVAKPLPVVAGEVRERMRAYRRGMTSVIDITFDAPTPEFAAEAANAYAAAYIDAQVKEKLQATVSADAWLKERIEGMRNEVRAAEQAVAQYQARHGLLEATGSELTEQRVSQLQVAENAARADLAEKQARLTAARQQLASGRTGEELGEALSNPVIQTLRTEVAKLKQMRTDLEARYGPKHPDVINARMKTAQLEAQLQAEVGRIIGSLSADVTAANGRLASLRGSLSAAESSLAGSKSSGVGLAELERNAAAKRTLYETYLARQQQTSTQAGFAAADAVVVGKAQAPRKPSAPNLPLNLVLGVLGGLAAGGVLIALLELAQNGLRTGEQVERILGEPCAAAIPKARESRVPPYVAFARHPFSIFAESFRQLLVLVEHAFVSEGTKVLAVTSALSGEGKTTTAICFARAASRAGAKVLMIDCDVRQRSLTRELKLNVETGLSEALTSGLRRASMIVTDPAGNVDILPVTGREASQDNLVGSAAMRSLLDELRADYDLIILDCPPVLAVADACAVAPMADGVLFLIKWQSTPAKAARIALETLRSNEAHILGVVLTQVDLSKQPLYGDGVYSERDHDKYYLS
jgi:succinoglycan biosynthesis transport protein ExoP